MKKNIKLYFFLLLLTALSSCGVFKPGCHCPKVSYQGYTHSEAVNS